MSAKNKVIKNNIRRTGINIIGDASWGTHFCQFYSTKQDLIDILIPYFSQGLRDNEFCMWVTSEPLGVTEAISALRKNEPRLDDYISKGQIEILDYSDWYLHTGKFNADIVLQGWISKLENAQKRGYDGLRLTGNTFWLENKEWPDFTAYEETINRIIGNYNMIAICTYNMEKCTAFEIMDVMSNHQFALVKREGRWQIIENNEHRLTEAALKETEQRYTAIFEKAPFAMTLTKMPEGTLAEANNAFLNMFEFKREEILGKTSVELGISDTISHERIKNILNEKGSVRNFETIRTTKTKKQLILSLNLDKISIDSMQYILATIHDITDRKLAEKALANSNKKLADVLDSIQDDLYTLDYDWNFVFANRQFTSRIGKEPKDFAGQNIWKLFPKHLGNILEENLRATMEMREARHFELRGEYTDNWYFMTSFPSVEGITVIGTEITQSKRMEQELRMANYLLDAVTSGTKLIIATIDKDFRYTYFNKVHQMELKRLTGKEERLGMSLMEILSDMPDQLKIVLDLWGRALNGETIVQVTEFGHESRYKRYYQTRHVPIYDDKGNITGAGEVTADITEYMQSEKNLKQSREDMTRAQEVGQIGSWRLDLLNNILTWSEENHRIFGIPNETTMNYEAFLEIVHPDDREYVDTQWKEALSGKAYDIEHRIIVNEQIKWVREKAYLEFDDRGNLVSGFGITQDITSRKHVQESLRVRTNILAGINRIFQKALTTDNEEDLGKECLEIIIKITGSKFGFIGELGPDGLLHDTAISETGWNMCNMSDKTGHNKPYGNFKIHGLYGKVLTEGKGFFTNNPASHPDSIGTPEGHPSLKSFIGVPLLVDSKVTGIITAGNCETGYSSEDLEALEALSPAITEAFRRIRAERNLKVLNETLENQVTERTELAEARNKQLQALAVELIEVEERERRRFAELLHDDLQQIIVAAKMKLEIATKKLLKEPALGNVSLLLDESIKKLRILSRELSPTVLYHTGFVSALIWLTKQMKEQFGLHVDIETNETLQFENIPLKIFIFRAVQELLFNIVKHAEIKTASISLIDSNDDFLITVSDHGKGFDPNILNHTDKYTGFGLLGLRERANYIGCNFTINSSPGKGSNFTLRIPTSMLKKDERQKPALALQPAFPAQSVDSTAAGIIRIMFVDDHEVIRQGLINLVTGQPDIMVVGEASNGREAIDKSRQLKPDIIIMDVSIPEIDGIEATQIIKTEQPRIRIIGLSMHDDEQLSQKMYQAGVETFINKSTSSAELLKAIYGLNK